MNSNSRTRRRGVAYATLAALAFATTANVLPAHAATGSATDPGVPFSCTSSSSSKYTLRASGTLHALDTVYDFTGTVEHTVNSLDYRVEVVDTKGRVLQGGTKVGIHLGYADASGTAQTLSTISNGAVGTVSNADGHPLLTTTQNQIAIAITSESRSTPGLWCQVSLPFADPNRSF